MKNVLLLSFAALLACGKKPAESNTDAAQEVQTEEAVEAAPAVEAPAVEESTEAVEETEATETEATETEAVEETTEDAAE